jgi:hypothetical protein
MQNAMTVRTYYLTLRYFVSQLLETHLSTKGRDSE